MPNEFEIGNHVTVAAPATFQDAPIPNFGDEDTEGEVTYAHQYLPVCYVLAGAGEGYVDNAKLTLIGGE